MTGLSLDDQFPYGEGEKHDVFEPRGQQTFPWTVMLRLLSPRRLLIHSRVKAERLFASSSKPPSDSGPSSSHQCESHFPATFFDEFKTDTLSAFNYSDHPLEVTFPEGIESVEIDVESHLSQEQMDQNSKTDNIKKTIQKNRVLSDLKSFIHACINQGMLEKAHSTFIWYRYRFLQADLLDLSVYNLMLRAWADLGKTNKVKEVFRLMALAHIQPDLQSFACSLLAFSRHKTVHLEPIKNILESINSHGYRLEELFVRSKLSNEQRQSIIKLLNQHEIKVEFNRDPVRKHYHNELLEKLNEEPKNYRSLSVRSREMMKWLQEQKELEDRGIVKIKSVYRDEFVPKDEMERLKAIWDKCELEWRNSLRKSLQTNLALQKSKYANHQGINIYPFLSALDFNDLLEIVMDEISILLAITEHYSPPASTLYRNLGRRVQSKYLVKVKRQSNFSKDIEILYSKYLQAITTNRTCNSRVFMEQLASDFDISLYNDFVEMQWSPGVRYMVGKFLYDIISTELKFDVNSLNPKKTSQRNVPVLFSYYKSHKKLTIEEIKSHPVFLELARKVFSREVVFGTTDLPMVVPPMPWISQHLGGYILSKTEFIRDMEDLGTNSLSPDYTDNCLPILDAINALQMSPWKVNSDVLDIAIEVLNDKGNEKLDIPLHESVMPPVPKVDKSLVPSKEKFKLLKQLSIANRERAEMYSLWCTCLYKLSIANHYRNRLFWMPINMDFRSRCYTIPPHLTHIGDDLCRGLMLFGEGKPLGPKGLDWLKIHVINLTGLKKLSSLQDRLDYANEIMDKILDSADNPLTGEGWWKSSDEPWQTLACCKEIAAIVRSPDPEKFISHFPVHQDGSCNGLQHYAALGRDAPGGAAVNLVPHNTPQDVYTEVAKIVEKKRYEDAESGREIAKVLEGFIRRKVVKQTVMTFVYGVTKYGARAQIMKQLKDIDDFNHEKEWEAAGYLTSVVFDSIQQMFTSTREIQFWLTECATVIAKSLGQPVKWTTPLGFPAVQPYFKSSNSAYGIASLTLNQGSSGDRKKGVQPNALKQKNGLPPNFIHSLDSSHMMLTALNCEAKNIEFVSIHDCFWTHASTVDDMNKIIRQEFVKLHSLPILNDLSDSFLKSYSSQLRAVSESNSESYRNIMNVLTRVPHRGSLHLPQVTDSVFFFS